MKKKADYTSPASGDANRSVKLCIRITPDQSVRLQRKADQMGCNISQAARKFLLAGLKGEEGGAALGGDPRRAGLAALSGLKGSFRKIAGSYAAFVTGYQRSLQMTNRAGDPAVSMESTIMTVKTLQRYTLALRDSLNAALAALGLGEMCEVALIGDTGRMAWGAENEFTQYHYMQQISISGNLAADAGVSASNGEYMKFTVICEDDKSTTRYSVAARRTGVMEYLRKGRQVFVSGEMKVVPSREGAPSLLVFADRIVLGK